jgi:MGS-like domain
LSLLLPLCCYHYATRFCGTPGTARYYEERGVAVKVLNKPAGATHNSANDVVEGAPEVDEYLREGSVDLVINIPEGTTSSLLLFVL